MTANLDQSRDRAYTIEALEHFKKKTKAKTSEKTKSKDRWNFALVTLFEVLLTALAAKVDSLNDLDIIASKDLTSITENFKDTLLASLNACLRTNKLKGELKRQSIICTLDALEALGIDGVKLNSIIQDAKSFILTLKDIEKEVVEHLDDFMARHARDKDDEAVDIKLGGNVKTMYGRQAILDKVQAIVKGKDQDDKLELLESLSVCRPSTLNPPEQLLSIYHVIKLCAGPYKRSMVHHIKELTLIDRKPSDDDEEDLYDLSSAYAELCAVIWKTDNILQFSLISETLEDMLRTKVSLYFLFILLR
jgi:hypothetical protein